MFAGIGWDMHTRRRSLSKSTWCHTYKSSCRKLLESTHFIDFWHPLDAIYTKETVVWVLQIGKFTQASFHCFNVKIPGPASLTLPAKDKILGLVACTEQEVICPKGYGMVICSYVPPLIISPTFSWLINSQRSYADFEGVGKFANVVKRKQSSSYNGQVICITAKRFNIYM